MVEISRLELQYYKNNFRSQYKNASMMEESQALAIYVLVRVFGLEWARKNVIQRSSAAKASVSDFLPNPQQLPDGQWFQSPAYSHRIITLADMIFNLQNVSGIDNVLDKMRSHSIEPYYAELVAGKILRLHDILFEYRSENLKRGQSYDANIFLQDGRVLPCEMKCKCQATDFSQSAIENTLNDARKQLPAGEPGVIFLEIPQRWPGGFDVIPPDNLGGRQMMQMWVNKRPQLWHGIEVDGGTARGDVDVIAPFIKKLFRSSQRVAYVIVHTDARYDLQTYSPAYLLHLKKMLGVPESTEMFYTVRAKSYKNPSSYCSADLPQNVLEKTLPGSNWLKIIDV